MAIPGLELTERPWAGSADARTFARDPGPGNPNVGRETLRTSAPAAAPAAPPPPNGGGLRSAWDAFTGNTKNMVGPQPQAGAAPVGTQLAAPSVAPPANSSPSPAQISPSNIFPQGHPSAGRSPYVSAPTPPTSAQALGRMHNPTPRTGAQMLASGLDSGARAFFDSFGPSPEKPATTAAPTAPNPTDQRLAAGTQTAPVGLAAAAATPAATSASPAATALQTMPGVYQHGRGQYSDSAEGMGFKPGFTGQPNAQNLAAGENLSQGNAQRSLAAAAAPQAAGFPGVTAPSIQHSGNSWQAENNLRNLRVAASSITNDKRWGGEGSKSPDVQAYQRALDADTALRGGMDPGSVARTNATASMYGDETRADAARYGSDNSLRGTLASAGASRASAEARLRYDANKDSRDFKLRSDELGLTRDANRLKQREASEKNMVDRIAAAIPPGPDGKPNTAAAAEQVRAMTARMADRQAQLEAELAKNPNNAQARSELANIQDNGVGAVGMRGMDSFQTGMEAKSLRKGAAGWTPWSGKDVESNKPITSLKREEGLIWDDYVDNQGGRIPAREIDKRREQYKHLIQGN